MATGWAPDGAVQEQIDASIRDAIEHARRHRAAGPSLAHCAECGVGIPVGRQQAIPGVRLCVSCQAEQDADDSSASAYNRRGSKDSQLR